MNKLAFFLICLVGFGCGMLKNNRSGANANANQPAANAAAEAELSKKFYEIDSKRAELGTAPKTVQLTKEPYLKGKVLFLKTRKSQPPIVENPTPVVDKYSPPPPPSDLDQFKDIMAVTADDIGTIVLIENPIYEDGCKEVEKSLYQTEAGKPILGKAQVCEVTIIDRSIPAVIFTKKIEAQMRDKMAMRNDRGYVLARVDNKEIYDFIATLPRR
jgi:hypothetical protein